MSSNLSTCTYTNATTGSFCCGLLTNTSGPACLTYPLAAMYCLNGQEGDGSPNTTVSGSDDTQLRCVQKSSNGGSARFRVGSWVGLLILALGYLTTANAQINYNASIDAQLAQYSATFGIPLSNITDNSDLYTVEVVSISDFGFDKRDYPTADYGSRNMSSLERTGWAITRKLSLPGDGLDSRKRQNLTPLYYTTETFLSFWNGVWYKSWAPECYVVAYGDSSNCLSVSKSEGTSFSVTVSAGWRQIISAKIGAEVWDLSTKGHVYCVHSSCGCRRLWTQTVMTWNQGSMYTDHWYAATQYSTPSKTSTDRQDNIHIDAGMHDPAHGDILYLQTGGSPCSDGPSWCGTMDGACGGGNAWTT